MASNKNYANGVFINERQGNFGQELNLEINKEQFLTWLGGLQSNEKGKIFLRAQPQKNDKTKFSLYENDYRPNRAQDTSDDLPF